jgi:hypothetical protein
VDSPISTAFSKILTFAKHIDLQAPAKSTQHQLLSIDTAQLAKTSSQNGFVSARLPLFKNRGSSRGAKIGVRLLTNQSLQVPTSDKTIEKNAPLSIPPTH